MCPELNMAQTISGQDLINNKSILKKYIYKSRVPADCTGYMTGGSDLLRVCVSICLHRISGQASGSGGSDCREWALGCRSRSAFYWLWCLHRWAARLLSGRRAEFFFFLFFSYCNLVDDD